MERLIVTKVFEIPIGFRRSDVFKLLIRVIGIKRFYFRKALEDRGEILY